MHSPRGAAAPPRWHLQETAWTSTSATSSLASPSGAHRLLGQARAVADTSDLCTHDALHVEHRGELALNGQRLADGRGKVDGDVDQRLCGWDKLELAAGERRDCTIRIDPRLIARFDPSLNGWRINEGEYRFAAGKDALDLALGAVLTIGQGRTFS